MFFFVFRIKFFGVVTYFYNGISRASQIKLQTIGFSDRQTDRKKKTVITHVACINLRTCIYM